MKMSDRQDWGKRKIKNLKIFSETGRKEATSEKEDLFQRKKGRQKVSGARGGSLQDAEGLGQNTTKSSKKKRAPEQSTKSALSIVSKLPKSAD